MLINTIIHKPQNPVAVIIPIYKRELSSYEKISLARCLSVLGNFPVIVIAPVRLSDSLIRSQTSSNVLIEHFDDSYFADIDGYNRLMLRVEFYERFKKYAYILIHQLDAFVFSNELIEWCRRGYDYVGAPWIGIDMVKFVDNHFDHGIGKYLRYIGMKPKHVGNGGFSLRKVKSAMIALSLLKKTAKNWTHYEDIFWSIEVPKHLLFFFKIPDANIARKFSFELEPRRCYKDNFNRLPFGCHAWQKYDIDFWRPFFKQLGYVI